MTRRALALRALHLGDFLAGVPALRALRRALPDHELVLAAPGPLRPLVELSGTVDALLPTGELEPVPWPWPPPDLAIDLHGNGPESRVLLEALAPARLVAYAGHGPEWDPDEHERARWCRLVEWALGVAGDPDDVLIDRPSVKSPWPSGAVVLHPGAASGARRWPAERFAAVARWAVGADLPVVVTGSPAERGLARHVCELADLPDSSCAAGRTGLLELADLVARARLVVCGDTGVAHVASAYAVSSVVLFGPTPPSRWGPPEGGPHDAVWLGSEPGDPHADEPDPALLRITADEVIARAAHRIGKSVETAPS